jgi:hypothetical protein
VARGPVLRSPGQHPLRSQAALDAIHEGFRSAVARVGGSADRWYTLAGATLKVRFAGPALLSRLTPALDHLASPPVEHPDLTVCAWDTASTGVAVPGPPDAGRAGADGPVYALYQPEPESLSMLSPARQHGAHWVPDAGKLTSHECAAPLRPLLHWWQRECGRQLVHGGAVGTDVGAVLLAGPSGAGKSTCALACLLGGLDYLGDDYVLLDTEGEPSVHCVYSSAKLNPDHVGIVPSLVPLITNPGQLGTEKALWFLHAHYPRQVRRRLPLRAVLVPRVGRGRECRIERISAASALLALAPSTIVQLRGAPDAALEWMARCLAQFPCYRLDLGREPAAMADAVREVLARC